MFKNKESEIDFQINNLSDIGITAFYAVHYESDQLEIKIENEKSIFMFSFDTFISYVNGIKKGYELSTGSLKNSDNDSQNVLYLRDKKDIEYIIDNFDYMITNDDDEHIIAIDIIVNKHNHIIGYIATNLLYNVTFRSDTISELISILESKYDTTILNKIKKDI